MIISEIPYTEEYVEALCSQPKCDLIQLGSLKSYNINIQVKVEKSDKHSKGLTTLTLREVPKFLVDAFKIIRSNIEKEGLFRKGGNSVRINSFRKKFTAIYAGREIIPAELNYLDVCSLIKSFIKTLKIPLLYNHDLANKLLELARRKEAGKTVNGDDVQELFQPRNMLHKEIIPKAHIGTLGFLMRELYWVSQHSEKNGMTIQNLATIFGPTLFDIAPSGLEKERSTRSVCSILAPNKIGSMDEARQNSQRAATAVAILIERATWIGLHRECYVSSQARSSSAAPLRRTPLSQVQPLMSKRSSQPATQHNPTMIKHQHEDVLVREEAFDRGFRSAVKHCARRSLDLLTDMSPLPGRRTIRSFPCRQKSSDTLTSDEDRLPVEQMSTSEEALDDVDRKTRFSSNFMVEREVQTIDETFESLVRDRTTMIPQLNKINQNSTSVSSERPGFSNRQSTSPKPGATNLSMPTFSGQHSEIIQSRNESPIKSTIVPQLDLASTRDPTTLDAFTRGSAFLSYSRTFKPSYSSFTDLNTQNFDSCPESPTKATVISRLNLDPIRAHTLPGNFFRQTEIILPNAPLPSHPTSSIDFNEKTMKSAAKVESPPAASISRKRLSATKLYRRSPIKSISRQRSTDDFGHSDEYRNAIMAASSASELDMGNRFDQRPSVAAIFKNQRGLVRDRVNQFGGGNLSMVASSGRPSTLSNTSKPSNASEFQFDSLSFS